jgi:hypothetical protein
MAVITLLLIFSTAATVLASAQDKEEFHTFKMVDTGKTCVVNVSGYYRGDDPDTGTWVRYPAEGIFTVTLSPVPTNDVWYSESWWGKYLRAYWENWKPTVKGTITIHKPEGDITFNVNWRGDTEFGYYDTRWWKRAWARFETWYRVHEAGPEFNIADLYIWSYSIEPRLGDQGRARVSLYSTDASERYLYLSGTYELEAKADLGEVRKETDPTTEYLKAKGTRTKFKMVDTGKHLTIDLSGQYYEIDPKTGRWIGYYPAEGKLSLTVRPIPTDDGQYRKSWSKWYGVWYEYYNAWWEQPTAVEGTVTIHKPEGDIEFQITGYTAVTSGFTAIRWGDQPWRINVDFDYISPTHEGGKDKLDFYNGDMNLGGINLKKPKLPDEGSARLCLYGIQGRLWLWGTYEAVDQPSQPIKPVKGVPSIWENISNVVKQLWQAITGIL